MSLPALSLLWILPVAGGVATLSAGRSRSALVAVASSLAVFAWALALPFLAPEGLAGLSEAGPLWSYGIRYRLAADGLSLSLCWLTAFLTSAALAASWAEKELSPGYWASFLFLEGALLGVFLSRDLFSFFVFWEAVLIPMFFLIGLWGSEGRRKAAMKFFLFTFFGSVFLLIGILALVTHHQRASGTWTWEMEALRGPRGPAGLAVFAALAVGFGVKVPIVPLHTWLPDAHTEAPASASVMLAGVLLKMGVYGFLRIALPAFPELSWELLPWLGVLAAVNVLYGGLCAMAQSDLKRLVAYSSVAHLGFCLLGIFSRTPEGLSGGSLQMLNHGLSTGALFMMVGFLYERCHRRGLADFGALARRAPWLALFFGLAVLSSIGLPGTNGFVGEFMALAGMTRVLPVLAVAGLLGVTLSAAYALPAFQAVFWDEPGPGSASPGIEDLDPREKGLLWCFSLLILAIGLCPRPLLGLIAPATQALVP